MVASQLFDVKAQFTAKAQQVKQQPFRGTLRDDELSFGSAPMLPGESGACAR